MAYIGMRNPKFWPISTPRVDGSAIVYGDPVEIGPAVSANVTFETNDNPDYGNDVIIQRLQRQPGNQRREQGSPRRLPGMETHPEHIDAARGDALRDHGCRAAGRRTELHPGENVQGRKEV